MSLHQLAEKTVDRLLGIKPREDSFYTAEVLAALAKVQSMKTIYLCGPINGCTDEECKDWREHVKALWPGKSLDPMRRDYRGREAECVREIVELDKIDVANSDVILVNYDKPSVGTSMEVLYAWERGKLVIVVCRPETNVSPWLRYHSHAVLHSWGEAIELARERLA